MLTCMTDTPYPKFTVYVFVPVMGEDTSIIGMLFKISIIGMQHNEMPCDEYSSQESSFKASSWLKRFV